MKLQEEFREESGYDCSLEDYIEWLEARCVRKCEQCRHAVIGDACTHKGIGYGIECHLTRNYLPVSYEAQCPAWEQRK